MPKKRSCRRTVNESKIHDKAVKMRKMTDDQLVEYIENRVEKARSEGYNQGVAKGRKSAQQEEQPKGVKEFLMEIQDKKITGIGIVTLNKLLKVATENGYIR